MHAAQKPKQIDHQQKQQKKKKDSPLRTTTPQRHTPTPHIANLRLRTFLTRTIRRPPTNLALIRIKQAHKRATRLHRLRHAVPERSVQRGRGRPSRRVAVRLPRGVFQGKRRAPLPTTTLQILERLHIGDEGPRVDDVEATRVDFVQAEAGVQVRQRRDRGPDPGGGVGVRDVRRGGVVGVVDQDLVFVRVAEEDVGDDVGEGE